jgi:uncharacterized protein (DUF983 family)
MREERKADRLHMLRTTGMDGVSKTRVILRGLLMACAACGSRGLFHHWWKMRESCPKCALVFDRSDGYWIGAVAVNTMMSAFLLLVTVVVSFLLALPDPQWQPVLIPSVAVGVVMPIFLDPISRTFWTSMVAIGRPPEKRGESN